MNYVKKMCILRQIKQGFSGDGKPLSGLIKIEQYGKNVAVEVSVINFAPLSLGEYYCLLSDGKGKTEMLALRGKSFFNILSDLDVTNGFCGIVCYVGKEIVPVAYGINGNGSYDWKRILNAALPPVFPSFADENPYAEHTERAATANGDLRSVSVNTAPASQNTAFSDPSAPIDPAPLNGMHASENKEALPQDLPTPDLETQPSPKPTKNESPITYDDETVAAENYYEENEHEQIQSGKNNKNASSENAEKKQTNQKRADSATDADAARVLHPFTLDSDGYYLTVKGEVDDLFKKYPRDQTLKSAFSCSEWVRIQGAANAPKYLVGVVYEEGKVRYICYAIAAKEDTPPPSEIKNVCSFVPCAPYCDTDGFYVIFQSAATGECLKPVS